jgi:hypothetical protein
MRLRRSDACYFIAWVISLFEAPLLQPRPVAAEPGSSD